MYPNDFGPIYTETVLGRFPVEPWNTLSNLVFLFVILFIIRRTGLRVREHPFTVSTLPILVLGFIGGTVFHATRSSNIWLLLDFIPIIILALAASTFFWQQIVRRWTLALLLGVALPFAIRAAIWTRALPIALRIGIGYATLAICLLTPAFIVAFRRRWRDTRYLLFALLFFAFALYCRVIDNTLGAELLPMGTHFLWHIFGGLAVLQLVRFVLVIEAGAAAVRHVPPTHPSSDAGHTRPP